MKRVKTVLKHSVLVSAAVVCFFAVNNIAHSSDIFKSISKNLTLLGEIYKRISVNYVDNVDPDRFFKAGLQGMLGTLDPYTNYIEQEDKSQLDIITDGKYGGLGMLLMYRDNVVTVAEPPFLGTPAARSGIREGDKIIRVDSLWTKDLGFSRTSGHIRGTAGSEVVLTIKREGEPRPLIFTLVRELIKVDDLVYAGEIVPGVGYLKLTRFSRNAGTDIGMAIQQMDSKDIRGLIVDLRSNPGGMLTAAVDVSDLFLPREKVIVSTRGRVKKANRTFVSITDPVYGEKPLIVLVNRFSASASEIVAGAVQDHDRGIVIGDTTFGKGLVQTLFPLSRDSAVKITTAKYYTPSGRCIQRQNYSSWDSVVADTSVGFATDNGRAVTAGGGIAPDVYVAPRLVSDYVVALRRQSLFFNFAVKYANSNQQMDSSAVIKEAVVDSFKTYISAKSFKYTLPIESQLNMLRKNAESGDLGDELISDIDALRNSLAGVKDKLFIQNISDIKLLLRQEMASKLFGTKKSIEIATEFDPVVQRAIEIIKDSNKYNVLLKLAE